MSSPPASVTNQPAGKPVEEVSLWNPLPATQPARAEILLERGKNGKHDRTLKQISNPRLRVFLPLTPDANRPACIICPGGGYSFLTIDNEGEAVARMLNENGVAGFVLLSRLPDGVLPPDGSMPAPIADIQRAIRILRANADQWNIDPNRIGVVGFSAGGHVASTAATQFDAGNPSDADSIARASSRPDFAALLYPVISMHDPIAHIGSRHNLMGMQASSADEDRFSADLHITAATPPLFLMHAEDDHTVPVENSLRVAEAASKAHVPCELVLFKTGGHGFGLGIHGGEPTAWPKLFIQWMHTRHILSDGR